MSDQAANGGTPNAFVAQHATKLSLMPMDEVALLGVAGPDDAMRAMIRMSDGSIVSGTVGERTELGRLLEVSPAGVVLELTSGNATFLRPYPWGSEVAPG